MEVVVIGGGAAGLTAAIYASKKNKVTILEKNHVCGKKISITGNGKCNFFNDDFKLEHYNSENIELLNKYINEENKEKILNFIKNIGVESYTKEGYYYPLSNQATTIQNALIKEVISNNIKIDYDVEVLEIIKENQFKIITNNKTYYADKVIIATGSKAFSKTGSDGIGYKILKKLGHKIIPVVPSLVQLETKEQYKDLAGVRTNAILNLKENNKVIKQTQGELQLTNYGISGICTFNLSSIVSRGLLENKKEEVFVNFIPTITNFVEHMDKKSKTLKNRTISDILDGMLNYKIVNQILKICNIKNEEYWYKLKQEQKNKLKENLTNFKFEIIATKDFDNAQTCSGGIPLIEVNEKFESKIIKDLFIIGELLDVDGECGGYNLGFAFLSGMIAGSELND